MKQAVNVGCSFNTLTASWTYKISKHLGASAKHSAIKVKLTPLMFSPALTWEVWAMCYGSAATKGGVVQYYLAHGLEKELLKQQMPGVKSQHAALPPPSSERRDRRPLWGPKQKHFFLCELVMLQALSYLETYWSPLNWPGLEDYWFGLVVWKYKPIRLCWQSIVEHRVTGFK